LIFIDLANLSATYTPRRMAPELHMPSWVQARLSLQARRAPW